MCGFGNASREQRLLLLNFCFGEIHPCAVVVGVAKCGKILEGCLVFDSDWLPPLLKLEY
jgi:hypothetical protein